MSTRPDSMAQHRAQLLLRLWSSVVSFCSHYENKKVSRVKDLMPCSSDQVLRNFSRLRFNNVLHRQSLRILNPQGCIFRIEFDAIETYKKLGVKGFTVLNNDPNLNINFMPFGRIFRV